MNDGMQGSTHDDDDDVKTMNRRIRYVYLQNRTLLHNIFFNAAIHNILNNRQKALEHVTKRHYMSVHEPATTRCCSVAKLI